MPESFASGAISLAFFSTQAATLLVFMLAIMYFVGGDLWGYVLVCLSAAVCIVADVVLIRATWHTARVRFEEQRAEALRQEIQAYAASYDADMARVEQVAKMRHDLRNHLQVATRLIERGELAEAGAYLEDLARGMHAQDEDFKRSLMPDGEEAPRAAEGAR